MSWPAERSGLLLRGAQGGALMAVASMSCVQLALALSVHLFGQLGPLGVAGLRLVWAGLLLLALVRPRLREFTARDLSACCALGVVTAGLIRSRAPSQLVSCYSSTGPQNRAE